MLAAALATPQARAHPTSALPPDAMLPGPQGLEASAQMLPPLRMDGVPKSPRGGTNADLPTWAHVEDRLMPKQLPVFASSLYTNLRVVQPGE